MLPKSSLKAENHIHFYIKKKKKSKPTIQQSGFLVFTNHLFLVFNIYDYTEYNTHLWKYENYDATINCT